MFAIVLHEHELVQNKRANDSQSLEVWIWWFVFWIVLLNFPMGWELIISDFISALTSGTVSGTLLVWVHAPIFLFLQSNIDGEYRYDTSLARARCRQGIDTYVILDCRWESHSPLMHGTETKMILIYYRLHYSLFLSQRMECEILLIQDD